MPGISAAIRLTDNMTPALKSIVQSINLTVRALESVDRKTDSAFDTAAVQGAKRAVDKATASMNQFEDQVTAAEKKQQSFNKTAKQSGSSFNGLIGKLGAVAAGFFSLQTLAKGIQLSDDFAKANARLALMNDGLQSVSELNQKILASANDTRVAYDEAADFVGKLGIVAKDAFSSTDEIVAFSSQVQKLGKIGGSGAQEMSAGMLQMQQGLASGVLRGEELNSVMENMPAVAQAIAAGMGVSTGELRNMGAEGELTADRVKNAILNMTEDTNARFATMPKTFEDVWTVFKNNAQNAFREPLLKLNELANSKGFSRLFESLSQATLAAAPVVSDFIGRVTDFLNAPGGTELVLSLGKAAAVLVGMAGTLSTISGLTGNGFGLGALSGLFKGEAQASGKGSVVFKNMFAGIGNFGSEAVKPFNAIFDRLRQSTMGIKVSGIFDGLSTAFSKKMSGMVVTADLYSGLLKDSVMTKLSPLKTAFGGIIPKIGGFASAFLGAVPGLGAVALGIGAVLGALGLLNREGQGEAFINELVGSITTNLPVFVSKAVEMIQGFVGKFIEQFPTLVTAGVNLVLALINGLITALPVILTEGMNLVMALIGGIVQVLPTIVTCGVNAVLTLIDGIVAALPELISQGLQLLLGLVSSIVENLPTIITAGVEIIIALIGGLIEAIPKLIAAIPTVIKTIFEAFGKVDWLELGKNIIKGIIEGLGAMLGALWEAAQNIGNSIMDAVKGFFNIQSPSKRMRDEVGKMIPAGIGVGVSKGMPKLLSLVNAEMGRISKIQTSFPVVEMAGLSDSAVAQPANVLPLSTLDTDFSSSMGEAASTTESAVIEAFANIKTGTSSSSQQMSSTNQMIYDAMSAALQTDMTGLEKNLTAAWQGIRIVTLAVITDLSTKAMALFKVLTAQILATVNTMPPQFRQTGQSMISELQAGIESQRSAVLGSTSSLVQDLLNTFITGLGIHSPSKQMQWIGEMMAAGIIKGLSSDQINQYVLGIIEKMQSSFASGKLDVGTVVDKLGDNVPNLVAKLGVDPKQAASLFYPLIGTAGTLTSVFGGRDAPTAGASTNHGGIDLAAPTGTPIAAVLGGLVTIAGGFGGYGNAVKIDHGNGIESLYGHMSAVNVSPGQQVSSGQVIGAVGSTGISTGPHLHLSMYKDGEAIDPLPYVQGAPIMAGNTLAGALMAEYNRRKFGTAGTFSGGGDVAGWIMQALAITGQSMEFLDELMYIAQMESGGDPNAINLWDSNAAAGHPSKGLMQTIDSTFDAYKLPGYDDIWNPVHNTIAAIRYLEDVYGGIGNHPGLGGSYVGYAVGTRAVPQDMLAMIHRGEAIFPAKQNPFVNSGGNMIADMVGHLLPYPGVSVSGPGTLEPEKAEALQRGAVTTNQSKTVAPVIHVEINNQNTINKETDADFVIDKLTRALAESLLTSAQGLYKEA